MRHTSSLSSPLQISPHQKHVKYVNFCFLVWPVTSQTWWAWTRDMGRAVGVQRAQWWRVPMSTATVMRNSQKSGIIVGEQNVECETCAFVWFVLWSYYILWKDTQPAKVIKKNVMILTRQNLKTRRYIAQQIEKGAVVYVPMLWTT